MSGWMLLLAGCGKGEGQVEEATWSNSGRELVQENCTTCHATAANAPFPLTTLADVQKFSGAAAAAIRSGEMPPWRPDPECSSYVDERLMSDQDRSALLAFLDAGAPQGDGDDAPAEVAGSLSLDDATDIGVVPDYVPDFTTSDDDYRCFVLTDVTFPDVGFIDASEVRPQSASVHHVLVYAIGGDQVATVEAADGADGRPGYQCLGSPLPSDGEQGLIPPIEDILAGEVERSFSEFPNQLAGWVPGGTPQLLPDGHALRVSTGSVVVAQVHYSAVGGEAVPDRTEVHLRRSTTPPTTLVKTSAVLVYDLAIPAGAPSTTFVFDTPYYAPTPLTIGSVAGHMHLLGTEIRGEVLGASGENRCLLDIPDWDFHWQGSYQLSEPMQVQSGESLRLSCTYDATDRTEDVAWGEGSEDEMCLLYLSRTEPYPGEPEVGVPSCVSGATCSAGCDGDYDCMLDCVAPEPACRTCVQSALTACAPVCAASLLTDLDCAERCVLSSVLIGGSTHACLEAECPDVSASVDQCYGIAVNGPECTAALDACGL